MSWIISRTFELISRTFQSIFELISRTFLPKNVEGISNFKEMEHQPSFQIPISLSFLKFIKFQDFPGHIARFQDILGHFFISRTFQDFPESGNPEIIPMLLSHSNHTLHPRLYGEFQVIKSHALPVVMKIRTFLWSGVMILYYFHEDIQIIWF